MVILGNPPYSGHSANKGRWINALLQGLDTTETSNGRPTHSYYHIDGARILERNPKWLRDDYVKFIRFAQWRIDRTGSGILAFITNHGYLNNPTFRAMRCALMETFDDIFVLDLHGNVKKKERSPDGTLDQNVFDIQQGVAIGIFVKRGPRVAGSASRVFHADLWGVRETWEEESDGAKRLVGGKYHFLGSNNAGTTAWAPVSPSAPFFSFIPRDPQIEAEWQRGYRLPDIMPVNVLGFQTHRDRFAVGLDREEVRVRVAALRGHDLSDESLRQRYRLKDNRDWSLASARSRVRADANWEQKIVLCLYRPFDVRWCYFSENVMDYPRRELLDHVAGRDNLCLLSSRQQGTAGYRHSWVSRLPAESCVVSSRTREQNYAFPIYRYPTRRDLLGADHGIGFDGRRSNFDPLFLQEVAKNWGWQVLADGCGDLASTIGPEDVAAYIYALLSSPPYRERYAEPLREDFPRIFVSPSADVAREMVRIGHRLIGLHLLEGEIASYSRLVGGGSRLVGSIDFVEADEQAEGEIGRITINASQAFEPVSREVWEFEVGGFQVCHKWLADRNGRHLSADDVETYRRIIGALAATLGLMGNLEELIDDAGGLPFAGPR